MFRNRTDEELVGIYNSQVGNPGSGRAKTEYLAALADEFLHRGIDCSAFFDGTVVSARRRLMLLDRRLVYHDGSAK